MMEKGFINELDLLCSHAKLDRDKGTLALKSSLMKLKLQDDFSQLCHVFESNVLQFLDQSTNDDKWEDIFGHFLACKVMLELNCFSKELTTTLLVRALKFLDHGEFRVRIIAGEILGVLCRVVDVEIYKQCEPILIKSIKDNLTRDEDQNTSTVDQPKDAKDIFHDTAGWKCLETSMKGLQAVIEGCGADFITFMNFELLNLIFETLQHTNRFVRETGYYLCASLARYGVSSNEASNELMADKLCNHLQVGLADNWSQVRLAASVATRQFFQDMNTDDRKFYFSKLLPPMCLNRYYLAEGVKLYNQETWRLVLGNEGRKHVEMYIKEVVEFYISQTISDNHAVREAACHCMAELGSKISPEVVKPYVSSVLDALHVCFKDQSWPVRDTACVACGNFILSFPVESRALIEVLYPLFFANLSDPIPSVRQGAAVALRNVCKAYELDALQVIFEKIYAGLRGVESQSPTSERYEGLEKGAATYGVIKQLRDNDFDLHSNQQMYSCGSLAPKMSRGGGCMDHCFQRESEPWETADGCVYLLGELSNVPKAHAQVQECMDLIATAGQLKHYTHHVHFCETICKVLPVFAKGLGKRVFKQYLEKFLDIIFYSLTCENGLTKSAASECLRSLSVCLGPNILRGRIEQYNPSYLRTLDESLRTF